MYADPLGHAVGYISLWQLDCRDCRFETRWGLRCSSPVFVVCCVRKWPLRWADHLFKRVLPGVCA